MDSPVEGAPVSPSSGELPETAAPSAAPSRRVRRRATAVAEPRCRRLAMSLATADPSQLGAVRSRWVGHSPVAGEVDTGRGRQVLDVNAWWRWGRLTTGLTLVVALYFAVPVQGDAARTMAARIVISVLVLAALAYAVLIQVRLQLVVDDRRVDGLVLALA